METIHLPEPAAPGSCPAWHLPQVPTSGGCGLARQLKAGFGSYIHHVIHGLLLARSTGLGFVATLHDSLDISELRGRFDGEFDAVLVNDPRGRSSTRRKDSLSQPDIGCCHCPRLSCFFLATGGAALPAVKRPCASMTTLQIRGSAQYNFSQVASAAADLLRQPAPPLASFLRKRRHRLLGRHAGRQLRGCIAVQLRYGDSCGHNSNHTGRICGQVDEYVRAVERLEARYGYTRVVVASDSASARSAFLAHLPGKFEVELPTPDEQLTGDTLEQQDVMVENLYENRTEAWAAFEAFLLDLHALSSCDAIVGKFTSNMARLVLELMSARLGRVAPFISLDAPWCFGGRGASPYGRGFFPC